MIAAVVVFAALVVSTEEASYGLVTDGQSMLSTACALSRFGELSISRDFPVGVKQRKGELESRYGLGLPLFETVPMTLSRVARALRPGFPTLPLFVLLPMVCLAVAAGGLARAAEATGLSRGLAIASGVTLILATPLWGYPASDLSEPLLAACVAVVLAGVCLQRTSGAESVLVAVSTGVAAGLVLLTKPPLVVAVVPLLLLVSGRSRRWAWGAFAVLAALWASCELIRFGTLFGGYGQEGFTHPLLDGLLRLTVFPNKGILVYAPALLLAFPGMRRLWSEDRPLLLALLAFTGTVFAIAATWWAWDGQSGWGPRLVVPALPALVLIAAHGLPSSRWGRLVSAALVVVGVAVNCVGALVNYPAIYALVYSAREVDGRAGDSLMARTPGWSPVRLHKALLLEKIDGGDVASRLATVGLRGIAPPLVASAPLPPLVTGPFRWPIWGRAFGTALAGSVDPYDLSLQDQAVRALDTGRLQRASRLASDMLGRDGDSPAVAALGAEAEHRAGRPNEAARFLSRAAGSCHAWIVYVRIEAGGDADCLPIQDREPFRALAMQGLTRGLTVSTWARAAGSQ